MTTWKRDSEISVAFEMSLKYREKKKRPENVVTYQMKMYERER